MTHSPSSAREALVASLRQQLAAATAAPVSSGEVLSSGCPPLDALLPRRGWERGVLVEWLAESLERFSPLVGWETVGGKGTGRQQLAPPPQRDATLTAPDYLLLDITGIGPLFGGEAILAEQVLAELQQQGYRASAAVADTIGAAWGMANSAHVLATTGLLETAEKVTESCAGNGTKLECECKHAMRKCRIFSLKS